MHTVIVANGELEDSERLRALWRSADLRVAADGGAVNARHLLDLPPQVLVGDLDSTDEQTRQWCLAAGCQIFRYAREKDETDLELALAFALARRATRLSLLGTLGGRFDQMIANVLLLVKAAEAGVQARLAGDRFDAWLAGTRTTIEGQPGEIVSLIPLSAQVDGITTTGLRYPLDGETLRLGSARGVSNELTAARAEVSLTTGTLLIVRLLDHQ